VRVNVRRRRRGRPASHARRDRRRLIAMLLGAVVLPTQAGQHRHTQQGRETRAQRASTRRQTPKHPQRRVTRSWQSIPQSLEGFLHHPPRFVIVMTNTYGDGTASEKIVGSPTTRADRPASPHQKSAILKKENSLFRHRGYYRRRKSHRRPPVCGSGA